MTAQPRLSRRSLLRLGALAGAGLALPRPAWAATTPPPRRLVMRPARVPLVGAPHPDTIVWGFDGQVPGPELRVRQGERLTVEVENRLPEETTVHWHGIRLPLAMDGVPHLSQKPIQPGETFTYDFVVPDAGTFWYHPHVNSAGQVGRGLTGALIVEERDPPAVDRDVTWVLADWRLETDASISKDFGSLHDASHAGRIGNTVTVNGAIHDAFPVQAGERLRLRLVNAANARIFGLQFEGHHPVVIALDGQPVEPFEAEDGRVVVAPGQRADVILDMTGQPGDRFRVIDDFYPRAAYRLLDLGYENRPPLRDGAPPAMVRLPPNPVPEPDLTTARRERLALEGGMMGRIDLRPLMAQGMAWMINGIAHPGAHAMEPFFSLPRGSSCVMELTNGTAWPHPMHLHGHSFRVLSRNGAPAPHGEWLDTVLLMPRERVEVAFVADEPGDWMLHCHVLEHQDAGMMGIIRIV